MKIGRYKKRKRPCVQDLFRLLKFLQNIFYRIFMNGETHHYREEDDK
jgi:hypothetical protein